MRQTSNANNVGIPRSISVKPTMATWRPCQQYLCQILLTLALLLLASSDFIFLNKPSLHFFGIRDELRIIGDNEIKFVNAISVYLRFLMRFCGFLPIFKAVLRFSYPTHVPLTTVACNRDRNTTRCWFCYSHCLG